MGELTLCREHGKRKLYWLTLAAVTNINLSTVAYILEATFSLRLSPVTGGGWGWVLTPTQGFGA